VSVSKDVTCSRMLRSKMLRVPKFFLSDDVIFRGCYVSEDVLFPRILRVRGYQWSENVRWPRVLRVRSSVVIPDPVRSET
jgi:hypothetical protein